jgi:hypothetical protein
MNILGWYFGDYGDNSGSDDNSDGLFDSIDALVYVIFNPPFRMLGKQIIRSKHSFFLFQFGVVPILIVFPIRINTLSRRIALPQ